ncbi:MAG: TatD family hydrolase [Coxiellaceae bacterium]|nr:TatD family hydrolase [Coxiellaceae bacterium]
MLVDSHCHLNMLDLGTFDNNLDNVLQAAAQKDVEAFLCVNVDKENMPEVLSIAGRYSNVFASVGVHPSEAVSYTLTDEILTQAADNKKVVALGESGLDYHYNDTGLEQQRESFAQHLRLGNKLDLPVIVHSRAAHQDTIQIMRDNNATGCGGVMHCFTESLEMAEEAMELGFYISISGIVTFKNAANVQAVAKAVPLDKLLIETDAPYLTPVPYRGKPNGPQYVGYVAEKIAELKGISYEQVAEQTTHNFYQLFNKAVKPNDQGQ